jgi:MFS transporter, SP family, solute carrier family 2 (myo-inositol transporter), member 13
MTNSSSSTAGSVSANSSSKRGYNLFLLVIAGLGGLLYGMDYGIVAGALPYLKDTFSGTTAQLSIIVAAMMLGGVFSTLFAGMLAEWMGRKRLMNLCGAIFIVAIPMIALSHGYAPLFFGRLLEGISAGLIGVVIPLYLAECLSASERGKGTAVFQWLPVSSMLFAALIGIYFSYHVLAVAKTGDAAALIAYKDHAWRNLFWVALPPGILFLLCSLMVSESPRWLFKRGKKEQAHAALLRSRTPEQAARELHDMEELAQKASSVSSAGKKVQEPLLRRKYVVPFVLACLVLFCTQTTGVNSIIAYNGPIMQQGGLSDLYSHWGLAIFMAVNFLMTFVGMVLVDRKGRKFLLTIGTSGIILSLVGVGILFLRTEKLSLDAGSQVETLVTPSQELTLHFDRDVAAKLLAAQGDAGKQIDAGRASLAIIYSYGDYSATTSFVRSDDPAARPIKITRDSCVPANKVIAFFNNPLGNLDAAQTAPLKIEKALVGQVPDASHGWWVALGLFLFMGFFAMGPGVCVWLALSELMPTRIRSNGMSIALVLNQLASTTLAGIFLPFVSKHGYSSIFFLFASFTVLYFIVAAFFLPETKGKTLEEIEAHFEGRG